MYLLPIENKIRRKHILYNNIHTNPVHANCTDYKTTVARALSNNSPQQKHFAVAEKKFQAGFNKCFSNYQQQPSKSSQRRNE